MKRIITLFSIALMAFYFQSAAQVNTGKNIGTYKGALEDFIEASKEIPQHTPNYNFSKSESSSAAVLYSEDFNGGLNSWTTSGANATLVGYDTDGPDNLIPLGWGPLPSPTAGNGFVTFDWYNNFQDPNGFSTSPAQGKLTSPVISLAPTDTLVEISFFQQLFWCCEIDWEAYLLISTDGGTTFTDSVVVNWVDRNERHWDLGYGYEFTANISDAIKADPTNIVLQFDWTSLSADQNGQYSNNYFWMIDDIELRTLPRNSFKFTEWQGAPEQDVIYNNDPAYGPYGHLQVDQIVPINFDANFVNYGWGTQTNASLIVEIWNDATGTIETTLTTSGCATLENGDTCNYNDLTTPTWTPTAVGDYTFVFKAISDSISASTTTTTDTLPQIVSNATYGMDRGILSNVTSTRLLAVAALYPMNATDGNNQVLLSDIETYISTSADSTADIEIAIYDTTGFPGSSPTLIASNIFTLTGADLGTVKRFDMSTGGTPLALPAGPYYVQASFFPNATDGSVRIGNDGTMDAGTTSLMLYEDGVWYSGFGDASYQSIWLRPILVNNVSVTEQDLNSFSVYPNPVTGYGFVEFEMGGSYEINVYDMVGNAVRSIDADVNANERIKVDYDNLPAGVYLLNVAGEGLNKTVKLTVQ